MKPLKLTISAFGSYADTQTIDFTELGTSGLYLITGETGSGKTTIFDAVSYALFGRASGNSRNKYQMLRSDYAEGRVKTFVDLDFSVGNDVYNITRTIVPHIARKNAEVSYSDSVLLMMPDKTTLDRDSEVSSKIAAIIGLDRDQFAQIVMIAQNDFMRFLQSGTDDRVKILRRIFGTSALRCFQENLKARAKELEGELALCRAGFERHEVDPYKRDEQFAAWTAQITSDKIELAEAEKQLDKYEEQKKDLAAKTALAEEFSKKFSDLDATRAALAEHLSQAETMKSLDERRARAEIALRRVKPLADKALETKNQYSLAQSDLTRSNTDAETAFTELTESIQAIAELPSLDEKRTAFDSLKREWEQSTGRTAKLTALKSDYDDIANKEAAYDILQAELSGTLKTIAELPPMAGAQAAFEKLKGEYDRAETSLTRLTALKADYAAITAKQYELNVLRSEFESLNTDFNAANDKYKAIEVAFLRGQAGILAAALTLNEPCPVCGSTEHPSPACLTDEDITESKLKKAKDAEAKSRGKRDSKTAECSALIAQIETLATRFLADLSGHISDAALETAGVLLSDALSIAKSDLATLASKKTSDEGTLSELAVRWDSAIKKRDEINPKCTELKSAIETLKKRFIADFSEFVTGVRWEEALESLTEMLTAARTKTDELTLQKETDEFSLAELTQKREAATKRNVAADKTNQAAQTLVAERVRREREQLKLHDEAQSAYAGALQTQGFSDEAEYTAAIVTEDELSAIAKRLADYEKTGERLNSEFSRLTAETADEEKPDLDKLASETETVNTSSAELRGRRDELKSRIEQKERALDESRRVAERFSKLEKRYAAIKQLSDTANGKLDFETYAQMAYFERVIRAANTRLKLMSQNRYALLRKTDSDDGRKRSGLELEVMDAYTGKARSANSLSGGESFMASLSLALGLSDVVQQSAG
ncbi:MAG: SMC family ATPase, partial [Synergistaceae bacterium]|nr:SMC family ATPase [Synergistaceae bacterium]